MDEDNYLRRGYWEWNDDNNTLQFVCTLNCKEKSKMLIVKKSSKEGRLAALHLTFRTVISAIDKSRYLRRLRRELASVITMVDVKAVALYCVVEPLPEAFQDFFQLPVVDRWLRALVFYMQYYVQSLEELTVLSDMWPAMYTDRHPPRATELMRDLTDLRTLLAHQHCTTLFTCDLDMQNLEMLMQMAVHIVWVCLSRRTNHLRSVEHEMSRLFRTDSYSKRTEPSAAAAALHGTRRHLLDDMGREKKVVTQKKVSRALNRNSPLLEDFINPTDQLLLEISQPGFTTENKRLEYLSTCLNATEEELDKLGINIGILGQKRELFDAMLFPVNVMLHKTQSNESIASKLSEYSNKMRTSQYSRRSRKSVKMPELNVQTARLPRDNQWMHDVFMQIKTNV